VHNGACLDRIASSLEQRRRVRGASCSPLPGLTPKLLAVLPHDPGRWFEPNANSTPVINIGALGGDAPDDIFGG